MRILNRNDIMETIGMLTDENLDVRTVTMGISLLDCIDPDGEKACEKIYNKITRLAGSLVSTVDSISSEYGIPIVNKRISVTPIAMLLGAAPDADPVMHAKALDRAAPMAASALVHKAFRSCTPNLDRRRSSVHQRLRPLPAALVASIPPGPRGQGRGRQLHRRLRRAGAQRLFCR